MKMENKLKFLVIDDNEIDRLVTGRLLKIHLKTVNVHYATTGRDGIEWLKANNESVDYMLFILLDIRMPGMDGFKFLEAIEKLDNRLKKNINVFMLSSTLNRDELKRAMCSKYVKRLFIKPLPVKELVDFIPVSQEKSSR